jgi:hypothetical protein
MNSARRGEHAKPAVRQPYVDPKSTPAHTFATGFSAHLDLRQAQCVPSATPVDFKAKVTTGRALTPTGMFPSVQAGTVIEARSSGK